MVDVSELLLLITGSSAGASAAVREVEGGMGRLQGVADASNSKFSALLGTLAKVGAAVGAVAIGGGIAAVDMAAKFQTLTTQIVTGAGESAKNLDLIRQGILQIAPAVGSAPDQLAQALYNIESAGFHGAAGLEILKITAEGAKVGMADQATVADAVTSALNAYHMGAGEAAAVTNDLIATVASGKMHMQDLAGSLSSILPIAASLGVPLNQVSGAIATMTMQGTGAQTAAQSLRFLMASIAGPTAAATKELQALGVGESAIPGITKQVSTELQKMGLHASDVAYTLSHKGLQAALEQITEAIGKKFPAGSAQYEAALKNAVGGTRGLTAALELTGRNAQTFAGNVDAITTSVKKGGDQISGWKLIQDDFSQAMQRAVATVQSLAIRFGMVLLPTLTTVFNWMSANALPILGTVWSVLEKVGSALFTVARAAAPLAGILAALWATDKVVGWGKTVISTVETAFGRLRSMSLTGSGGVAGRFLPNLFGGGGNVPAAVTAETEGVQRVWIVGSSVPLGGGAGAGYGVAEDEAGMAATTAESEAMAGPSLLGRIKGVAGKGMGGLMYGALGYGAGNMIGSLFGPTGSQYGGMMGAGAGLGFALGGPLGAALGAGGGALLQGALNQLAYQSKATSGSDLIGNLQDLTKAGPGLNLATPGVHIAGGGGLFGLGGATAAGSDVMGIEKSLRDTGVATAQLPQAAQALLTAFRHGEIHTPGDIALFEQGWKRGGLSAEDLANGSDTLKMLQQAGIATSGPDMQQFAASWTDLAKAGGDTWHEGDVMRQLVQSGAVQTGPQMQAYLDAIVGVAQATHGGMISAQTLEASFKMSEESGSQFQSDLASLAQASGEPVTAIIAAITASSGFATQYEQAWSANVSLVQSLGRPGGVKGAGLKGSIGSYRAGAAGGILDEPIVGVGLNSGIGYTLAESGREAVIPLDGIGPTVPLGGAAGGGASGQALARMIAAELAAVLRGSMRSLGRTNQAAASALGSLATPAQLVPAGLR